MNTFQSQTTKNRPTLGDKCIIGIDPGETTGICTFVGQQLYNISQLPTGLLPLAVNPILQYIAFQKPSLVVMEDYRVYEWKAKQHSWIELHTPKLIGALQYALYTLHIPLVLQSAQTGKGFCSDERLIEWGFYTPAKRHAMDAVRHACHFLMFGKEQL